ncbi:MAG: NmrA family protein, partial [Bdellovibrionaceae bacterium]|nr:NmrA family protein [Bdellovibrio sp.]
EKFKLLRAGGLGFLKLMIKVTKLVSPTTDDLYPPWQGMQYLQNMYSGITKFDSVDNDRYLMRWTKAKDILAKHLNLIN